MKREELYMLGPPPFLSTASDLVIPSAPSDNVRYLPSSDPVAYTVWPLPPETWRREYEEPS